MNALKRMLVMLTSTCLLAVLFIVRTSINVVESRHTMSINTENSYHSIMNADHPSLPPKLYLPEIKSEEHFTQTSSNLSKLVKLHWTSLYGKHEKDSYHFFSAYYDSRANPKHHRPAVFVLGYIHKEVPDVKFYCVLKYSNGSKICLKEPAYRQHPSTCFSPVLHAKELQFFCEVGSGEEPPVSVHLSTSNTCEPQFFSGEIPVRNRKYTSMTHVAPKKFGVCIGGPLVEDPKSPTVLKDVVEFVEMSTTLGVELIVLYVNETQVDIKVLEFIWKHYPNTVRTVGWKAFDKWYPMHYYGQLLIISDCLYRVMYEVEYLAVIDLDEMIIPVQHNNWGEMVTAFGQKPTVASFTFQNAFFDKPRIEPSVPPDMNCPNTTLAKYFSRIDRHKCYPGHSYRPKLMTHPKYIYEHNIHYICFRVDGHKENYNVPGDLGILGHYRPVVPDDCVNKPKSPDYVTKKFMDVVTRRVCARMKDLGNHEL